MRVAILHYWLVGMRGGERVLEHICHLFPGADIFTHVYDPAAVSARLRQHKIKTTFIQRLPWSKSRYQSYLPLMPVATEQIDLRGYDLIISSESGPIKGVLTDPGSVHICYCHSPMRYVWDMYHDYRDSTGILRRLLMPALIHYLRAWDQLSAGRVDHFIANSKFVASRIQKAYRRDATVIHPPVAVQDFYISENGPSDYYLLLGQLVPYKRADLAVKAFSRLGKRLLVIGEGEEFSALKKVAGPTVQLLGRQPFSAIRDYYANCKALVFPGVEDFGIVPLEAMASGRPVLAYGSGGALETIRPGVTGLFFPEQTEESLMAIVEEFEATKQCFDPVRIRDHAKLFSEERFQDAFRAFVQQKIYGTSLAA